MSNAVITASDKSELDRPDLDPERELGADAIDPSEFRPARTRALKGGAIVIAICLMAAIVVPAFIISARHDDMLRETEDRLRILASGRAEVLETWLQGTARLTDRAVESELLRLFAAEVQLAGGNLTGSRIDSDKLVAPLVEQLPLIQRVITDFANDAGFLATALYSRDGEPFAVSAGAPPAASNQRSLARSSFATAKPVYGTVRASNAGLVMDIALPVFPVQQEAGVTAPAAVFLITVPVEQALRQALAPHPLAGERERSRLLQVGSSGLEEIMPGSAPPVRPSDLADLIDADPAIAFAARANPNGEDSAYSVGTAVSGPPWWVLQEIDVEAAQATLNGFATAAVVIAALVVATVIVAFGAFWWRLSNEHNHTLAAQFRRLAARISSQKRLLDSINDTITDYIGLKDGRGRYRYINPAFARAVGRDPEDVTGLDDAALFGRDTAERLGLSDKQTLATGEPVTASEEIHLGARLHHLQISKVPYINEAGVVAGVVSVTRDMTDLVEQQKKKEKAIAQMVRVLVQAIEARDPYLAGHSRRVAAFAVAIGKGINATADELTTLELAANLSQIGKLSIRADLLTKAERLSAAEIAEVQEHLTHAADILEGIDFELPVLETLMQMHERLDGNGYPAGVKGEQISLCGRILAVCDVFCARIEPRSYRTGIPAEEALAILESQPARYDGQVVAALREVVRSVPGEKLISGVQAS